MRVVVDYDVDRLQVYNGDIKPSSTNCPNLFLKRFLAFRGSAAELQPSFKKVFKLVLLVHLVRLVQLELDCS